MAVGGLMLARLLGPQARGEYALLNALASAAAMLLTLGLGTSNAVFASQNRLPAKTLFSHSLLFGLIVGGLAALMLAWHADHWTPAFLQDVPVEHAQLMAWGIPFYILFNCLLGLSQGRQQFELYSKANVLRPLLFLCGFAVLFFGGLRNVLAGLWAYVLSFVGAAAMLIFKLRLGRGEAYTFNASAWKLQFQQGWTIYLAELFSFLLYRIDVLLVGFFLDVKHAGFYSIVTFFAESLWFLPSSIGVVLLPSSGARPPDEMRQLAPRLVRLVFFATSLIVSLLWQIDQFLVTYAFGEDFLPAVLPLHLSYLGIVAMSVNKVIASYALGSGHAQWNTIVSLAGLLANVILNLLLIPRWGIAGAAIAMSLSFSLMALLMILWLRRFAGITLGKIFILQPDDWRFVRELWQKFALR